MKEVRPRERREQHEAGGDDDAIAMRQNRGWARARNHSLSTFPGERCILAVVLPADIVPRQAERLDVAPGGVRERERIGSGMAGVLENQLGAMLTGPGHTTFAIGAALFAGPLLILLGIVDRWLRKRPRH